MSDRNLQEAFQEIADRWEGWRDSDPADVQIKAADSGGDVGGAIGFHMRSGGDTGLLLSVLASLGHRMERGGVLRCEVTDNPVGTDTWGADYECDCEPCQMWLAVTGLAERGADDEQEPTVHHA